MAVTVYKSTDASAPVLTGAVGSLVALLDACLVNGYGAKATSGWTKPFTGTNKASYRMVTTSNTGFYLNVDDSGGGTGGAREAFMTGYQTMTALATGTGQFPTSAQLNLGSAPAGAVICRKSNTADATARAWTIVADGSCVYVFIETADFTTPDARVSCCFMFGDIFSYASTDLYRCAIIGRNVANSAVSSGEMMNWLNARVGTNTAPGHFMAAQQTGLSTSLVCGKHTDSAKLGIIVDNSGSGVTTQSSAASGLGAAQNATVQLMYPNSVDGGLLLAPLWIHHTYAVRGYMKGAWAILQNRPVNPGDTFSGSGALAGKTFQAIGVPAGFLANGAGDYGMLAIETSNTWS